MTLDSSNLNDTLPPELINFSVYKNSLKKNAKFCRKLKGFHEYINLFECSSCHDYLLFERGIIRPFTINDYGEKENIPEDILYTSNSWYCLHPHPPMHFCYGCYRKHLKEAHNVIRHSAYSYRQWRT